MTTQLGLRVKQRSVLSFNTPSTGLSRAMSQMCVDTPGAVPAQILSQDPGAAPQPSQPALDNPSMLSQGGVPLLCVPPTTPQHTQTTTPSVSFPMNWPDARLPSLSLAFVGRIRD